MSIWNDIFHHASIGVLLAILFSTKRRVWLYGAIGCAAALIPDVFKVLMNNLYFHSLLVAPFLSLLCAGILKLFIKEESFIRIWAAFFASLVFGHILLDVLDDGNVLFYPFLEHEYGYFLISKTSHMIWAIALTALVIGVLLKKVRLLAGAGVIAVILFVVFQFTAKAVVTDALNERYRIPQSSLIVYPSSDWPWEPSAWSYYVRSNLFMVSGYGNAVGTTIKQDTFYFTPPEAKLQYRVEEWDEQDGKITIKCFDEESKQTVYFQSEDGIHWNPADHE